MAGSVLLIGDDYATCKVGFIVVTKHPSKGCQQHTPLTLYTHILYRELEGTQHPLRMSTVYGYYEQSEWVPGI